MKVALYVRVSTRGQDLTEQERALRAEAKRRRWAVVDTYREKISASEGVRLRSRTSELGRLLHDAALKRFNVVLCWSMDRMGRSLLELLSILQRLDDHAVGVAFVKESVIDTSRRSAADRLILHVLAAAAEFERQRISERTILGMDRARREGKTIGRPRLKVEPVQVLELATRGGISMAARSLSISRSSVKRYLAIAKAAGRAGRSKKGPRFEPGAGARSLLRPSDRSVKGPFSAGGKNSKRRMLRT